LKLLQFLLFLVVVISLTPIQANASDENQTEVLQVVVSGGIDTWVKGFGEGLVKEAPISENGAVDVFAPIVAPVDLNGSVESQAEMEANKAIALDVARIVLMFISLFVLLQELKPNEARKLAKYVDGEGSYYYPKDIIKFALIVGAWFAFGALYLDIVSLLNNDIMSDMDTGVLNQVVVSSENLANYLTLGLCTKLLTFFMSIRWDILVYSKEHWFFLGLILAVKKSRWAGILYLKYVTVLIFVQALIVSILTSSVSNVLSSDGHWISDMGHYAGTSILLLIIVFIAFTLPLWIAILSPKTLHFIIGMARRA